MKKRLTQRAFTVAEMIIIIAVIGILATIIVPALLKTSDKAGYSTDQNTVLTFNNVLDSAAAMKTELDDIFKVRTYLIGKGYSENSFLPVSVDTDTNRFAFVWDSEQRVVLLVNLLYGTAVEPKEDEGDTNCGNWYFLTKPEADGAPASDTLEAQQEFYLYPCAERVAREQIKAQYDAMSEAERGKNHVFVTINDVSFNYNGITYPLETAARTVRLYAEYDGSKYNTAENPLGDLQTYASATAAKYNDSTSTAFVWALTIDGGSEFIAADPYAEAAHVRGRCAVFTAATLAKGSAVSPAENASW